MSLSICTSAWMFTGPAGTGPNDAWYPRIVRERMLASSRDGSVERAPDPVPFIDGDLAWTNETSAVQVCVLLLHRAPRRMVAANPNTYALDDAISWDVGLSPNAPTPYAQNSGIGARAMNTPATVNQTYYGRLFRSWDSSVRREQIGEVEPGETVHVRYSALYTTPGSWRAPSQGLQVVRAYWAKLQLWAGPGATP